MQKRVVLRVVRGDSGRVSYLHDFRTWPFYRRVMRLVLRRMMLGLGGILSFALAAESSWNQYRGPDGSGVAERFPSSLDLRSPVWSRPVASGLSAPVLAGGRLYLTAVEGQRLVTCAYRARTGALLWRQLAPEVPLEKVHAMGSPAASTPVADDDGVWVYFGSYGILSYDHRGRERWRKPLATPQSLYGMTASLLAYRDLLIVVLDNDADLPGSRLSQSRVIALHRRTGKLVWETPRPLVRSGWSTPTLWRHDGEEELVVLGSGRLTAYDPRTGLERWFVTGFSRETIAQPVSGDGLLFASAAQLGGIPDERPDPEPFWKAMLHFDVDGDGRIGRGEMTEQFTYPFRPELPVGSPGFGQPLPDDPAARTKRQAGIFESIDQDRDGYWTREEFVASMAASRGKPQLMAIRPGGRGDLAGTHIAWQLHRNIPEIPTPVFYRDRLYLVRDGGFLTAVNASTGEILANERVGGPGQYVASPVVAGGHLYMISQSGVVSVINPGATLERIQQQDLKEPVLITPAFDRNTLYLRTQGRLLAFRPR